MGIHLDSRLSFSTHFAKLFPRVEKTAQYLSRILPNTFGPGIQTQKLYANVIISMVMYGAPIWINSIKKKEIAALNRMQRPIAIRIAWTYQTILGDLLLVLAGMMLFLRMANIYGNIYRHMRTEKKKDATSLKYEIGRWRLQEQAMATSQWRNNLLLGKARQRPFLKEILYQSYIIEKNG